MALLAATTSSYALASLSKDNVAVVEKNPEEGLRGTGHRELAVKTCSKEKKVSIYKFCIEGDCDSGAEGEHSLRLDGQWLWGGFKDFREGQCHLINHSAKTVDAWKSLSVGTEEHDDWSENDSYFATMAASSWYSETCETYEIILAKEHTSAKKESMCWEMSAAGDAKDIDLGLTATRCTEWTKPSESFLWYLKVEPEEVSYITYPPTSFPTTTPTHPPTSSPTTAPTHPPTSSPTTAPTHPPTSLPTAAPTNPPTTVVSLPTPNDVSFETSFLGSSASSHASLNAKSGSLVVGFLGALLFLS